MPDNTRKTPVEEEIIKLLNAKNQRAISLLYEYYAPALYNIILQIVRSEAVAEEALQDAFLKIWQRADTYDPRKGKLFTWMARLCRNLAIDKVRSAQYKRGQQTESMPESVYNSDTLSEELPLTDPGLRKVVGAMDEKSRRLIELLFFKDYTQKEASDALDIPLGTVKSRSRKAIGMLRSILSKEGLLGLILVTLTETLRRYFGS